MNAFDTLIAMWFFMLFIIVCFQAYALRMLTKMREEE